ncbi:PAS domain S-box-containing protein [Haladaptatus litoreus]|uniref:PAS domain S-box-containing protein n=1 Tax=Haladaptatus litoreus TaxID=553468 RepID=A0A1N6UZX9_9EURY|nr:bacterio-opsin activator domain-containing protein [Haladaptatus litoreus]SIQ70846.1 PAS domain S-box-containing protein [Haladaptatus litoreus]
MDERTVRAVLDTLPDVFYAFDADGSLVQWNDRLTTLTGYDDSEIEGMTPGDFIPEEDQETIFEAIDAVLADNQTETRQSALLTKDGEKIPFEFNARRVTDADGTVRGFVGTGRNLSKRRERERELRRQHDELKTFNRINELVREVIHALVSAAVREEVEQTVCDHLVGSDLYRFAWVGDYDVVENAIVPRATAGDDEGYHEVVGERVNDEWERPAETVYRTGESVVVRDISKEPALTADLRNDGVERGIRSGIAVPLSHGPTMYGVLVVYANRTDAFSEREADGFKALGKLVGFAINATESKKLLTAGSFVELEFDVADEDAVLVSLSRQTGGALVLKGTVPLSGGQFLYYVRTEGVTPEEVVEVAETLSAVDESHVVSSHSDAGLLVLTVSDSLVNLLVEIGAKVRTARAEHGEKHLVVEVSPDADIRTLLDSVRSSHPDVELIAKREVDRPVETRSDFRQSFASDLTSRQRAAFRAAYLAGYYDWPRKSTAEDIADTMGIAPATLHQHLRKAEGKLASAFFTDNRE